ncbi:hypothetical protein PYW07_013991 [Mythimna separata]|uniref:Uncharacterized protein n=1 Tax=Mythimna separata TaxID=271217 RepID=A0AAD7YF57_MYTSE|nr:hypothetical protein PYW07_009644 [Mythimna separata]KAJ8713621.1 hypothetical protein PYW07_013991 [Mythimna separata]
MRQSARFTGRHAIVAIYFAFVRSKLEFNSIVWDPHETKYNLLLERVQRKFCRYLYMKMYGYYPYLYPSLFVSGMVGIDTLELRRKCALLVHYFLLFAGKIDNPTALSRCGLSAPPQYTRLRSRPLLATPRVRTRTAQYAATHQAVTLLNTLTAQHPDVDLFHSSVQMFLQKCKECFS